MEKDGACGGRRQASGDTFSLLPSHSQTDVTASVFKSIKEKVFQYNLYDVKVITVQRITTG